MLVCRSISLIFISILFFYYFPSVNCLRQFQIVTTISISKHRICCQFYTSRIVRPLSVSFVDCSRKRLWMHPQVNRILQRFICFHFKFICFFDSGTSKIQSFVILFIPFHVFKSFKSILHFTFELSIDHELHTLHNLTHTYIHIYPQTHPHMHTHTLSTGISTRFLSKFLCNFEWKYEIFQPHI